MTLSNPDSGPNLFCFITDHLHLGCLGAYGNGWIETPAFDSLALESVVFDWYYANTLNLKALYQSFWNGETAIPVSGEKNEELTARKTGNFCGSPEFQRSLPNQLHARGYRTVFLSDIPEMLPEARNAGFEETGLLSGNDAEMTEPVDEFEKTRFYCQVCQILTTVQRLAESPVPWLLWVHLEGMGGPWDFPADFRAFYQDGEFPDSLTGTGDDCLIGENFGDRTEKMSADSEEDGLVPYQGVEVPFYVREKEPLNNPEPAFRETLVLDKNQQSILEAYCGGITVWDQALEILLDGLRSLSLSGGPEDILKTTHFILGTGTGFPLGEHHQTGWLSGNRLYNGTEGNLYSESVHLPLLIRLASSDMLAVRSQAICSPTDLYETLLELPEIWSPRDLSKVVANQPVDPHSTLAIPADINSYSVPDVDFSTNSHSGNGPGSGVGIKPVESGLNGTEPGSDWNEDPISKSMSENPLPEPGKSLLPVLTEDIPAFHSTILITDGNGIYPRFAVVTPEWFLKSREKIKQSAVSHELIDTFELYVHPDDRWEVNEIASRCPETVELLAALLPRVDSENTEDGNTGNQ